MVLVIKYSTIEAIPGDKDSKKGNKKFEAFYWFSDLGINRI
jgi:hypothetical protein